MGSRARVRLVFPGFYVYTPRGRRDGARAVESLLKTDERYEMRVASPRFARPSAAASTSPGSGGGAEPTRAGPLGAAGGGDGEAKTSTRGSGASSPAAFGSSRGGAGEGFDPSESNVAVHAGSGGGGGDCGGGVSRRAASLRRRPATRA